MKRVGGEGIHGRELVQERDSSSWVENNKIEESWIVKLVRERERDGIPLT